MPNTTHTAKHTPGPWKWSQESVDPAWAIVTSEGGNIVANVNSETGPDIPPLVSTKMPQHANAALIAAAPDMLAALRLARKKLEMWPEGSNPEYFLEIKAIDKAIAKAEGN